MSEKIKCPVCDDDCSEMGIVGHLIVIHEYSLESILAYILGSCTTAAAGTGWKHTITPK